MRKLHIAIICALFIIPIIILLIGVFKEIQGCIIGGIVSIFAATFITISMRINAATNPPVITTIPPNINKVNIINPIYDTV